MNPEIDGSRERAPPPPASAPRTRNNKFNFLRFLFASLVIVSHSSELLDGNRSREMATRIFGTLSLGEIAVEGFFLVSGYLITKSFMESRSVLDYLVKRIARIYPAFLVAFLVSFFAIGPLVGGDLSSLTFADFTELSARLVTLRPPPPLPGALEGAHYRELNAAMWTIAYEFRCYLLTGLLGVLGAFRFRWVVLGVALALLALASTHLLAWENTFGIMGSYAVNGRFFGIFLIGASYHLFQDKISYEMTYAFPSGLLLCALMFNDRTATPAAAIFGGYLIFYFAFSEKFDIATRFANRFDISYGLYLYAWPVQITLAYFWPALSPWLLFAVALPISSLCGFLSWQFIESRAAKLRQRYWPKQSVVLPHSRPS